MTKPLFTIITSTFNAGHAIDIAASSVRAQHRDDVEYIIVDGASSDDTLTRLEQYRDVVTRIISEPDTGIYDAINKGIRAASGDLIGIIGADDSLLTGALDVVARYHHEAPAAIYAGETLLTTAEGRGALRPDEDYGIAALVSGIPFGHNAMFARRDAYERIGLYDTKFSICADAQWVHRAIRAGLNCTRIPRVLTQFSASGVSTLDAGGILKQSFDVIIGNFPQLSADEAKSLLYGVRGWADPMEIAPVLRKHRQPDLRESVIAALENQPDVRATLERRVDAASGTRASEPSPSHRPVTPRCDAPLFSFVIPAYNVERYIGKCLDSILSQPFDRIEVIVVDDGSADETATIVQHYQAKDGRIRLIRQANAGQGAARAVALAEARGEYIWCVDSDDRIQERVLDRIAGMFSSTKADVVVLNFAYEEENGDVEYSSLVPTWLAGRTVDPTVDQKTFAAVSAWTCPPWRYVVRKALLDQAEIVFQRGLFYEDHPFAIDVMTSARRVYVDSTVSYYYLRRSGSTVRSLDRRAFDFLPIRRMILDRLRDKRLIQRFPDITASYVYPINFIKAHVGVDYRREFLARIADDTRNDELRAVHAFGYSGELEMALAHERGELANIDVEILTGEADRGGQVLELSRTLSAGDVQGLSWREGPYPEIGIDEAFRWVDGDTLKVRLRTAGMTKPLLKLKYRNDLPGQFLLVEQNDKMIEMFPCRHVGKRHVCELDVPIIRGVDIVLVTITIRKQDDSSGRNLGLLLQNIDLVDLDGPIAEVTARLASADTRVVKGSGTNIAHLHVDVRRDLQPRTYVRIGKESDIGGTFVFERGFGEIVIGDRSSIGGGSLLICTQEAGITIGSNVMLSWNVTLIDSDSHSLDADVRANDAFDWMVGEQLGQRGLYKDWSNVQSAPIVIGDGAWVGFGSTILKGVTVGKGAIIGCNSVVTKDVPDYAIAAGNPARIVGAAPRRMSERLAEREAQSGALLAQ
ncbi:MAG: glycosyltransferase [Candidatus Sphingomonas phytovorans]|nr:glycosyltransferase [Sphingomonas sp.]WEJ99496.1 MAG: glycosyltransferase [Sphingomonas sp.]